jgi:chemotaxis protein CheC
VRAITGGGLPLEDIIGLEQEALAETGNIILNGCLAAIANMLDETLQISLPEILSGSGSEIFALSGAPDGEAVVLFLYINFSVKNRNIGGYIAVLMDLPSLTTLKTLLGRLIAQVADAPNGSDAL